MNTLKVEIVVPEWVNWMTVDSSGFCTGHETKPKQTPYLNGSWFVNERRTCFLYSGKPPKNWKDELYTWS